MRALKLVLPMLLAIGALAACSSDYRNGYAYGGSDYSAYPSGYYYAPDNDYDTYPHAYSGNDWLNHRNNSAYWAERSYEYPQD